MRKGDWIQTFTGRQFYPLDPRPEDICIRDIAHALSMQCRYTGHSSRFYSVAEHSLYVSQFVDRKLQMVALLHDASEAYICDIARPVKPMLANYHDIERNIMQAIGKKFGFSWPMPDEVKDIDNRILSDEKEALMGPEPAPWVLFGEPLGISDMIRSRIMSSAWAEICFLDRFNRLNGGTVVAA